jgi:hypothetical protein
VARCGTSDAKRRAASSRGAGLSGRRRIARSGADGREPPASGADQAQILELQDDLLRAVVDVEILRVEAQLGLARLLIGI